MCAFGEASKIARRAYHRRRTNKSIPSSRAQFAQSVLAQDEGGKRGQFWSRPGSRLLKAHGASYSIFLAHAVRVLALQSSIDLWSARHCLKCT